MTRTWVNYRAIKAAVSMEIALANYGIRLHRLDRHYLRGCCPLPVHTSKSSRRSFIVNTEKNAWACHSDSCVAARGGRLGGNVLDFVAAMESCSIRDAALRLQDTFILSPAMALPTKLRDQGVVLEKQGLTPREDNKPLGFALTRVDPSHAYLADRRVAQETARYFGIGYYGGSGLMHGRIVIPIHDEHGFLVAYAGRSIDGAEPKYRLPPCFRKSLVLFNLNRAAAQGKSVVVVEGFFGCVSVHQAGLQCVVALMGCSLSRRQEELLQEHFQEVVLLLDGDKAGRNAGAAIAKRLVSKVSTRLVEVPAGSQPDQLGADQIRCLCIPGYF